MKKAIILLTMITSLIGAVQENVPNELKPQFEKILKNPEVISKYDFLSTFNEKYNNINSFYVVPIRYHKHKFKDISRTDFIQAIKLEGVLFFEGYTEPLYLQPLYKYKKAFKYGYPWSAPENKSTITDYSPGTCPNVETLHYNEIITIEHNFF